MRPPALLTDLRRRGIHLEPDGAGLRYRAPKGVLTAADHAALRQHRDELLALIRPEATPPADTCLGCCGTAAWTWCPGWPEADTGRWLCQTCRARPVPSLHEVAAGLTAEERRQLEAEAAAGDPLARVVVDLLAETAATIPATVSDDTAYATASWARRNGYRTKPEDFDPDGRHKATPPDFDTLVPALGWVERGSELAAWQARLETRTKGEMPDYDGRLVPARVVFPISTTNTESTTTATEAVQGELEALAGRREAQLPK